MVFENLCQMFLVTCVPFNQLKEIDFLKNNLLVVMKMACSICKV